MSNNRQRLAQVLATPRESYYNEPGLQPPAIDPVMLLSGFAGPAIARTLAGVGQMAPRMLASEAGSILPESELSAMDAVAPGAKEGDPHALFAYHDDFGPGMTKRAIYNVFGDPEHPAIQKVGWGSSVPEDVLQKAGIPIVGKQSGGKLLR